MNRLSHVKHNRLQRKHRIRKVISGVEKQPRLSVFISNRQVTAQLIDDSSHKTLVYVSTAGAKDAGSTMTEKAAWAGSQLAQKAKAAKVKTVILDRNGKLYHGRVKALADAARKNGLEF